MDALGAAAPCEGVDPTMKIYLANPRGFCAGVDRAIDIVDLSLKKYGAPIYVRHEIVHSRHVVNSLRHKGAVFVEELSEVPEGSVVIFSAHGVAKSVWDEANRRRLHVIDATCPLVIKVHNEVNRDYTQGYELILIGHAGHPEVIGTLGQIPDKFHLVSSVPDVERLHVDNTLNLSYVTQTTLSVDECRDIVGALHRRFPNIKGPHQEDICYATQNRQNAVKELSRLVDVILVIGSPNSSNSNRLRELGEQCGIPSYLIDSANDIDAGWLKNAKAVGIAAGASAPEVLVTEVVTFLKNSSPSEVEELTVIEEDVEFLLPKELVQIESSSKPAETLAG
jgi:4-hydroxy-3-methylbut-2-en-1-yl diphosphate reductase